MIIGGKRYCGKSTELIKISNINKTPIVVKDRTRARFLKELAKEMKLDIPEPLIYYEKEKFIGTRNGMFIEDLEDILQDIFRGNRILEMTTSIPFKPMDEITKSNNYGIHHVVAPIEKVKKLILTNHKGYMNLRLKEKVIIVKHFAKFENDADLLEFLEYMEEDED